MNRVRQREHVDFLLPEGWARPSGYSHAVSASGRYLFLAGQVGWNPVTQQFESDDFVAQVKQALLNIVAVLREGGAEPEHLVRLTWFITDRASYEASRRAIGDAYAQVIGKHYPAMSILVVGGFIEDGAKVEIEATAVVPE